MDYFCIKLQSLHFYLKGAALIFKIAQTPVRCFSMLSQIELIKASEIKG